MAATAVTLGIGRSGRYTAHRFGGGMQKLEEILAAEEQARRIVADARQRAEALVREAEAEARQLVSSAADEVAREASALRDAVLDEARAAAGGVVQDSVREAEAVFARARTRMDEAVTKVLERLQG